MRDVVIVSARRTAQGKFLGALSKLSAVDLGVAAARAALGGFDVGTIDQVIVGNVLAAGAGMNVARQIGVKLGLPLSTPAFTVNMMCASGMQAIVLAAQAIRAGDADVVLCGGTESMSRAPYLLERARTGYKIGDGVLVDSLLRDGLVDAFSNKHMGMTAELLAERYGISRADQDAFAADSQRKYGQAAANGAFVDELVAVAELDHDEHARADTTVEKLLTLKPAFNSSGSVTAGNSSGLNDGAAMLVVCGADTASARGWQPLAVISGSAAVGCDPQLMGLGPVHATKQLCENMGCAPDAFDAVELNEAFAAQSLACVRELKLDHARVNREGGAIAIGHPIGASGARIVTHLVHQLAAGKASHALASLCVGGGMGLAMALRSPLKLESPV